MKPVDFAIAAFKDETIKNCEDLAFKFQLKTTSAYQKFLKLRKQLISQGVPEDKLRKLPIGPKKTRNDLQDIISLFD